MEVASDVVWIHGHSISPGTGGYVKGTVAPTQGGCPRGKVRVVVQSSGTVSGSTLIETHDVDSHAVLYPGDAHERPSANCGFDENDVDVAALFAETRVRSCITENPFFELF